MSEHGPRAYFGDADAHLIAAAPDLLAACEAILANHHWAEFLATHRNPDPLFGKEVPQYLADCESIADVGNLIEAAVAKAKGGAL